VILLEIEPEKQNTKIDFITATDIGIPVCVTEIIKRKATILQKMKVVMKF
jgi:hypothetical protein